MYLAEQGTRFIITIQLHPQIIIQSRFTSCIFLSFTAAVYPPPPPPPPPQAFLPICLQNNHQIATTSNISLVLPHIPLIWCEDWPHGVVFLQYKRRTYSPSFLKWQKKRGLYHIIETKGQTPQTTSPSITFWLQKWYRTCRGKHNSVYHCIKMYSGFIDIHSILFTSARRHTQYCTSLKVLAQNITQNIKRNWSVESSNVGIHIWRVTVIIYKIR